MVMGGDSCSEGRGFDSVHHKLDGFKKVYICKGNLVDGDDQPYRPVVNQLKNDVHTSLLRGLVRLFITFYLSAPWQRT